MNPRCFSRLRVLWSPWPCSWVLRALGNCASRLGRARAPCPFRGLLRWAEPILGLGHWGEPILGHWAEPVIANWVVANWAEPAFITNWAEPVFVYWAKPFLAHWAEPVRCSLAALGATPPRPAALALWRHHDQKVPSSAATLGPSRGNNANDSMTDY